MIRPVTTSEVPTQVHTLARSLSTTTLAVRMAATFSQIRYEISARR